MASTGADCAQIEALISAARDGAATPEERDRMERHLAGCAACRATAAAYQRVDDELQRYLRLTPVPAIDRPWRDARARRAPVPGGWRLALAGLATALVLLVGTTILVGQFANPAPQRAERGAGQPAPNSAMTAAEPARGAFAATAPSDTGGAAAQPTAAGAQAAAARVASPAADTARAAAGAAPTVATDAPAAAAGGPAAATTVSAAAGRPTAARTGAAAPAVAPTVNPVRQFGLAGATALTVCAPGGDCAAELATPERRDLFLRALDHDLPRPAGPVVLSAEGVIANLTFTLPDGRQVTIGYDRQANLLVLPDNAGAVGAPPEFVAAFFGDGPP